jgi:hypothetical protein
MPTFVEIPKVSEAAATAVADPSRSANRAIAIFDLLGFRARVASMGLREIALQYENAMSAADELNRRARYAGNRPSLFPDHEVGAPFCDRYVFSDSIILVALDSSSASALKLLLYSRWLIQGVLAKRLPIRGAVAAGELYYNPESRITLGKALVDAYELEGRQEWLGGSIAPSFWSNYPDVADACQSAESALYHLFPPYSVPMKNGVTEELRVLSWRFNLVALPGTRELLRATGLQEVPQKFENTLAFARDVRKRGNLFTDDSVPPAECAAVTWIGERPPPFDHGDDL